MEQQVTAAADTVAIPDRHPAARLVFGSTHPDEEPLSRGARELVAGGIPDSTRAMYRRAWDPWETWCGERRKMPVPAAESTMIEYLEAWRGLPVHNRCAAGRQATGEPCDGHRPAPSSMWIWYSAVRLVHGLAAPDHPWYGGKRLALAMKHYSEEAVNELGWVPNKAPRAWPEHVVAMVDAMDLANPKDIRDRAVLLVNWYTGARAGDLATYRIGDVAFTPLGVNLTLRASKTNKRVGKVTEQRVLRPNPGAPAYDAVNAVRDWLQVLRQLGVTQGAMFRPFSKPGPVTGVPTLLRGDRDAVGYRMSSVGLTRIVKERAVAAGIPDGEYFTCHSFRRGRASHLRTLKVDSLAIGRALGWAGLPPSEYLEEAEAFDDEAPANVGLLR